MPAVPNPPWASDTWDADAWGANTWGPFVAPTNTGTKRGPRHRGRGRKPVWLLPLLIPALAYVLLLMVG